MSEELKNEQGDVTQAEATPPAGARTPRYANVLFPNACVHEPYTNSEGIKRMWVDLPAHTELNGQDMTGFRVNVRVQPWMEKQLANGDDVRIGFNENYPVKAFKGRGDDAQEVVAHPWDLAKGVKAAREAGHIAAYDYVKFSVPAEAVHPYERTAHDGTVYKRAVVDLPDFLKVDVSMKPWMTEQKEAGQDVQLSFEAGKDVTVFMDLVNGDRVGRMAMEMNPNKLREKVIAAGKEEKTETKESKAPEKASFKDRVNAANKSSVAVENAEKKSPEKAKVHDSQIGAKPLELI